jgi:adenylate cyclase class 2
MSEAIHQNLEIEVKFLVSELVGIRERLLTSGAVLRKPRIYEHNIRFDNPWDGLMSQGKLLRLRQDSVARITYKGHPEKEVRSEARVREELEIEVGDFETTVAILERIGFERRQVYEKYRETFELGPVEVVLDEMPFGDFVELEGEEAEIKAAADLLGLDWSKRIKANYLALMANLREKFDLPFDDLTFDNFGNSEVSAADILKFADRIGSLR